MSALKAVLAALSGIQLPKVPQHYEGKEDHYITYNYASDTGADFGDDRPGCNRVTVQVHYFLPLKENFQSMKNRIRYLLFYTGFTWPEVTVLEERDTNMRHLIYECGYIEEIKEE